MLIVWPGAKSRVGPDRRSCHQRRTGGNCTVDVPVSDDGSVAGAVRATRSPAAAWLRILTAWLIMAAFAGATLGAVWFIARPKQGGWPPPGAALSRRRGYRTGQTGPPASGVPEIDDLASSLSPSATGSSAPCPRMRLLGRCLPPVAHSTRGPAAAVGSGAGGPGRRAAPGDHHRDRRHRPLEQTISDLLALSRDTPGGDRELPLPTLLDELRHDHHGALADAGASPGHRVRRAAQLSSSRPRLSRVAIRSSFLHHQHTHEDQPRRWA